MIHVSRKRKLQIGQKFILTETKETEYVAQCNGGGGVISNRFMLQEKPETLDKIK